VSNVADNSGEIILSILVPVFNEELTIVDLIDLVQQSDIGTIKKEIIVINDGSTDKTLELLSNIEDIVLINHQKNQGKGRAIRTGIQHSTGDVIVIQDADLEYDPNDFQNLIRPIIDGDADVVYGSRRLKKDNEQHSALRFYIGGIVLTAITNTLYPTANLTDEPTCYKAFRASVLRSIDLKCQRFEFCPEVTAKILRQGINIIEVPISYYPRTVSQGKKISWWDGLEAIWTLLKYRVL